MASMNNSMKNYHWKLACDQADRILESLIDSDVVPALDTPTSVTLGEVEVDGDLISLARRAVREGLFFFADLGPLHHVSISRGLLSVRLQGALTASDYFESLSAHRWTVFSVANVFRKKWREYTAPSLSDGHNPHGWACAFKGEAHNRLVSRRWLEYGPWRLIRDEDSDLSFVQFHDLDADPETALEQAKPGHQRMGISKTGGFIQTDFVYRYDWNGFYIPDEQVLRIVVTGRDVEQREMLEACALRLYQPIEGKEISNVAYVFVGGEEPARKHLHELWLRELQCWAIIDGEEVRLDEDYDPGPPEKPEWVKEVEAREAEGSP